MQETLIRIEAPYFVAAIVYDIDSGKVITTAPIIKYMEHWSISQIIQYCEKKHWKVTTTGEDEITS